MYTFQITQPGNNKIDSYRKENYFLKEIAVIDTKEMKSRIIVRFYATDKVHYCCLWVFTHENSFSGAGKAGGYGYDKLSAAFQDAMHNAGLINSPSVDGVGQSAVEECLKYLFVDLMGHDEFYLHVAHP